jgi:DNA-binding transcriptional ArsR family regulator
MQIRKSPIKPCQGCGMITADNATSSMDGLPPQALDQVADFFRTLAEPARLQILNLLRSQEHNVGELAELTGYSIANVSRHLSQLGRQGFVLRESRGNNAYYRIADPSIYQLCDMVCGQIAKRVDAQLAQGAAFTALRNATAKPARRTKPKAT